MSKALLYPMTASPGKGDDLARALEALGSAVRSISGCENVQLLRYTEASDEMLMIETWSSREAHDASAAQVPTHLLGPVMAALANPVEGRYADYLI